MNLYAASVALLWSTALRMAPVREPPARQCAARRLARSGLRCDRAQLTPECTRDGHSGRE